MQSHESLPPPPRRGADGDGARSGSAAALSGRDLPVIVAEICVQRVQIESHSHGGARQLRDHLSERRGEERGQK